MNRSVFLEPVFLTPIARHRDEVARHEYAVMITRRTGVDTGVVVDAVRREQQSEEIVGEGIEGPPHDGRHQPPLENQRDQVPHRSLGRLLRQVDRKALRLETIGEKPGLGGGPGPIQTLKGDEKSHRFLPLRTKRGDAAAYGKRAVRLLCPTVELLPALVDPVLQFHVSDHDRFKQLRRFLARHRFSPQVLFTLITLSALGRGSLLLELLGQCYLQRLYEGTQSILEIIAVHGKEEPCLLERRGEIPAILFRKSVQPGGRNLLDQVIEP